MWIKYSTCQVASLAESCSQASSARGEDQWVRSAPKKGNHVMYAESSFYVPVSILVRKQQQDPEEQMDSYRKQITER